MPHAGAVETNPSTDGRLADDELIDRYLARLGLNNQRPPPTLETLNALIVRHVERVPFENLDVFQRRPIVLGASAAFEKIVVRQRGGFCFELNEAFRALLVVLGYEIRRIEARVWIEAEGRFGPAFDHLALVVTLGDAEYLVDVGFGDNNRGALRLADEVHTDVSGSYRLRPASAGAELVLERLPGGAGEPRRLYQLTLAPQPLEAYAPLCAYHQSSADSLFMKGLICTRATQTGRISLTRHRLIVLERGQRATTAITDEHMLAKLLTEHFSITL